MFEFELDNSSFFDFKIKDNLNLNDIPMNNIIEYEYNTSVEQSFNLIDNDIIKYN